MNGLKYRLWWLKTVLFLAGMLIPVIASSTFVFADTPFTVTSGGIGYYNIVLCDNATTVEQTAANELQTYIYKVTGVTLSIVTEAGAQDKSFMVGPTAFAIANGVNPTGAEQWAIKNVGNKIIVTGGRPRGTLYAVYHLLEDEIGVRWWNEWEEYVPSISTLTIINPINKSGTPAFEYREIFDAAAENSSDLSLFYVRNRLNGNIFNNTPAAYGGAFTFGKPCPTHTFSMMFPPEQYYSSHPEYYALINGERKRNGQLCLTNPNVIALIKQKTRDNIAASYTDADSKGLPRPTMFSISPNDAEGLCTCSACQAQRNSLGDSGYLLTLVNAVAADIAATYPEVKIDTLAYWYFIDPPLGGVTPRSNVQIRYANPYMDILHQYGHANNADVRSKLEAWDNITTGGLIFWDYAINYYPMPPINSMYFVKQNYQYLYNLGLKGIFEEHEGYIDSDTWDLKVWLEAKFMENPNLDLEATINDFVYKYYGAAATYINNYIYATRVLEDTTNNIVYFHSHADRYNFFTLDYVMAQTTNFNNAAAAVASDPVLLRHVNVARASLDRLILIRWNELSGEAFDRGITINFGRDTSSARLRNTLNQLKALRCMCGSNVNQCWMCKSTDDQMLTLLMPSDLASVPYRCMVDIPSENFRLYNAYGGVTNVTDMSQAEWMNHSLLGHAARVKLADISDPTFRDLHKPLIDIGLYNTTDGVRLLKQLAVTDIVPDTYKLYKIGSAQIKQHDYLYLFRSWSVQVDLDNFTDGSTDQLYDIYVSMKFKGPSYGGSPSDQDCVYIDRVILVGKGELPVDLSSILKSDETDFSPESFSLYTAAGGVARIEDGDALTGRSAKVSLNTFSTETDRTYHLPPVEMGLYNLTDGTRVIKNLQLSDIVLNTYNLYKLENVLARPGDCLYLFRSWYIKVYIDSALSSDPNQKYDIYVSMKFEGPAFGGDTTKKDAVYVDRVVVVRSGWENQTENLTVNAISSGDTHTVTNDSNMMYGKGDVFNANAVNDYIEYSVPVSQTGTYNVKVVVNKNINRGIFQLAVDGVNIGATRDNYSSTSIYTELDLGNVTFTSTGNKLFRFKITGKNASSSGYTLFTDYIRLIKQ